MQKQYFNMKCTCTCRTCCVRRIIGTRHTLSMISLVHKMNVDRIISEGTQE